MQQQHFTLEVFTSLSILKHGAIKWSPHHLQGWLALQHSQRAAQVASPFSPS